MKRALDFTLALVALVALAPVLCLIAMAIWISDFHAPFYAGRRIGRFGREFKMIKFRSMRPDAWKTGVNSTAGNDARITRLGKFLRRFKLDELPQLIHVLSGEMSLVGPRPQVPDDAARYTPEERHMLDVRPGVTDLASIVFADEGAILEGASDPDLLYNQIIRPWKSRLALLYMQRRSDALDLRILVWTALALISRRRALDCVATAAARLGADPLLLRACMRTEPLVAYPPPGAAEIVDHDCAKATSA
jgi:lipopolysaccharide/colanic/teichoic acid biosynthesis glycosyltransferase